MSRGEKPKSRKPKNRNLKIKWKKPEKLNLKNNMGRSQFEDYG